MKQTDETTLTRCCKSWKLPACYNIHSCQILLVFNTRNMNKLILKNNDTWPLSLRHITKHIVLFFTELKTPYWFNSLSLSDKCPSKKWIKRLLYGNKWVSRSYPPSIYPVNGYDLKISEVNRFKTNQFTACSSVVLIDLTSI